MACSGYLPIYSPEEILGQTRFNSIVIQVLIYIDNELYDLSYYLNLQREKENRIKLKEEKKKQKRKKRKEILKKLISHLIDLLYKLKSRF